MRYIKLFEEFEEPKSEPFMKRMISGTRKFLNIETKEDRDKIENIHRLIDKHSDDNYVVIVKNVREIKPGVIVCNLINGNLTVDDNESIIMFNGEELQLKNMDDECLKLYNKLENFIR